MPKKSVEQQAAEGQPSTMPPPPYVEDDTKASSASHANHVDLSQEGWVSFSMLKDTSAYSFSDYPLFYSPNCDDVPWFAMWDFSTKDLPALMKRGLHFSEENIIAEAGYIQTDQHQLPSFPRNQGFTTSRFYKLRDHMLWKGYIIVYARDIQELASFKPAKLSIDNIRHSNAFNAKGQIVYQFDRHPSGRNFNAIYDDMPLEGLWPWPKGKESEDGEAVKTERQ